MVEYREIQHSQPIAHFDKPDRPTVSGVHRGEQRKLYDQRRREVLPEHGIRLVELDCSEFARNSSGRLERNAPADRLVISERLEVSEAR